ncbi:hypothetical protein KIPB_008167, partial [Kipferlia bialata]
WMDESMKRFDRLISRALQTYPNPLVVPLGN